MKRKDEQKEARDKTERGWRIAMFRGPALAALRRGQAKREARKRKEVKFV